MLEFWVRWAMSGDSLLRSARDFAIGGAAGAALCIVLVMQCHDSQLERAQAISHQVQASAIRITRHAHAHADSLQRVVDSLARNRRALEQEAARAGSEAARFARQLLTARTARDSNVALVAQVTALQGANLNLAHALEIAKLETLHERHRGDSLLVAVDSLNHHITTLTSTINGLQPMPKFLRISVEVVKDAAFVWAGYQWRKAEERR